MIARHAGSLLTPRARGKPYLLLCKISTSHQTLACALAVPREGDSRVDLQVMIISDVHTHVVVERNRRAIEEKVASAQADLEARRREEARSAASKSAAESLASAPRGDGGRTATAANSASAADQRLQQLQTPPSPTSSSSTTTKC